MVKLTPQIIIETEVKYRNVERVWKIGYQGQGEIIPIIDTGVNVNELPKGAILSQFDLTEDQDNQDYDGHGTNMAKFIIGMAPRIQIVSIKVFGKNYKPKREDLLKAIDLCLNLTPQPKFINLSLQFRRRRRFLSYRSCTLAKPCILCKRINELWEKGIATIVAAGNVPSGPDTFTCPANARWAVKVNALEHLEQSLKKEDQLLGTSQASALLTGSLAVLASAFPEKPAASLLAVLQYTGAPLKTIDPTIMPNIYRAYVFIKQAITKPETMDYEKSFILTQRAAQMLKGKFYPSEIMTILELALDLDESNYLAYYYYSEVLRSLGMNDKAEELLEKCNELLPPAEALEDLILIGGQGGYPPELLKKGDG